MAVKYLDAKRLQGTNAERIALTGLIFNGVYTADTRDVHIGSVDYRGQCFQTGHDAIGKIPQKVVVPLRKLGSPTGDMQVVIVKADDSEILIEAKDISTLTTTFASYTFENTSQSYALANNDGVFLKFADTSGTNDSSNALRVYVGSAGGIADSTYSYHYYGGAWARDGTTAFQPMLVYDENAPLNLPSGTIFSTTDTYKYYWWDGTDTWSLSG